MGLHVGWGGLVYMVEEETGIKMETQRDRREGRSIYHRIIRDHGEACAQAAETRGGQATHRQKRS